MSSIGLKIFHALVNHNENLTDDFFYPFEIPKPRNLPEFYVLPSILSNVYNILYPSSLDRAGKNYLTLLYYQALAGFQPFTEWLFNEKSKFFKPFNISIHYKQVWSPLIQVETPSDYIPHISVFGLPLPTITTFQPILKRLKITRPDNDNFVLHECGENWSPISDAVTIPYQTGNKELPWPNTPPLKVLIPGEVPINAIIKIQVLTPVHWNFLSLLSNAVDYLTGSNKEEFLAMVNDFLATNFDAEKEKYFKYLWLLTCYLDKLGALD